MEPIITKKVGLIDLEKLSNRSRPWHHAPRQRAETKPASPPLMNLAEETAGSTK